MREDPIVCIVGRPNVGKSTLFNRIIGKRSALVENTPGVTRDRHYASMEHTGRRMLLVDTGGFDPGDKDTIFSAVREQCHIAIEEADVIIHVVDARQGLTPDDEEIASLLRKSGKIVLRAANKVDSKELDVMAHEFFALGADKVFPVSASHGLGVADLLDEVIWEAERIGFFGAEEAGESLEKKDDSDQEPIRVALIGRPNAGKSSLMNRLLGEDRALVHDVPGTTRDPVDVVFSANGQEFILVDTAGIRRRKYVKEGMELVAVIHAVRAMERAHVVCLVCDAGLGITEQEARLGAMVQDKGRAVVVLLNKWDKVTDSTMAEKLQKELEHRLRFISHCPVLKVSALTGKNTSRIPGKVVEVFRKAHTRLATSEINRFLEEIVSRRPPPAFHGKHVRLYYMTQPQVNPPTFVVFVSHPKGITMPYRRYIINRIRETFGFDGTAIRLVVRPHRDRPEVGKKKKRRGATKRVSGKQ